MDPLQTRLDALEQQVQALTQHTHTVQRRLHWWRALACGVVVLAGLTWALPAVIAQEEEVKGKGPKGLAQRVAALEQLLKHFSREKNEIFITGANLHIVNSLDSTDCTNPPPSEEEPAVPIPDCPNGLGNLIVGYNEPRPEGEENIRTGSHNVVVGQLHNFSRFGGLVVGSDNTISGDFAVVSGGGANIASGPSASVSGGASTQPAVSRPRSAGGLTTWPAGSSPRSSGEFSTRPAVSRPRSAGARAIRPAARSPRSVAGTVMWQLALHPRSAPDWATRPVVITHRSAARGKTPSGARGWATRREIAVRR
jgi:hypothetical protein